MTTQKLVAFGIAAIVLLGGAAFVVHFIGAIRAAHGG